MECKTEAVQPMDNSVTDQNVIITENRYSLEYFNCVSYGNPFTVVIMVASWILTAKIILDIAFVALGWRSAAIFTDIGFYLRLAATIVLAVMAKLRSPAFLKNHSDKVNPGQVCRWYFGSDGLHGDYKSANSDRHWNFEYSQVIGAAKSPKCYTIFLPGVRVIILYDAFMQGSAEDLERLMREKLGRKCHF